MERKRRTSPSKRVSPPRVTAKTGLRLLLPFLALTYAVMVWYGRRGKSGAIDFASSHACFGSLDERARERERHSLGEGTGVLENIASAYLIPGRLQGGVCGGRKVVAFAITLTKEGNHMDGAVVLAASIDQACARSEFLCDLVAFVHDDVGLPSENVLRRLGFRVLRPGLPLALTEIEDEWTRQRMEKGGCCGSAELMKFFAYTLTDYHRVVHLDTDVLVLEPLDPILESNMSLLFTEDVNMANPRSPTLPVQGGFMVLRPDLKVFDDLVQIVKSTPYTSGAGWGGSNIGLFWGGVTVQGLLPYYYEQRAPAGVEYRVVDRCEYNNMVDTGECQAVDISTVRTAHFTNCRKPWDCAYPHPKQPLCSRLFERWFEIRAKAEIALGLPPSEACRTGYLSRYSPIPLLPKTNAPKTDAPAVE